uniref:Uncharacterized protein n=1 Tax=Fagus sylvatica TaxID=28930 RepID=A0A2N9GHL6_FAGSY
MDSESNRRRWTRRATGDAGLTENADQEASSRWTRRATGDAGLIAMDSESNRRRWFDRERRSRALSSRPSRWLLRRCWFIL